MITLQEILNTKTDIFRNSKTKLVRHAGGENRYRELAKEKYGLLNDQKNQTQHVYNCDYIICFIGAERKKAILAGIFMVNGVTESDGKYPYIYDLEELHQFDDLIDRLIIDWGEGTRQRNQWYAQEKEIVEILPKGYLGSFYGLLDFVLDFDELRKLTDNPEANMDWKLNLSSVNGIYMILDNNTGQQYIGSANGKDGVWQRWCEYAANKTGGNKELIRLLEQDSEYQRHFRYSILQTLPSNITKKEIDALENLYKQKLGSRAHGLNAN